MVGLLASGSLASQHTLVDPSLGALPIADFTPRPVFCDDFNRQSAALVDPVDRILNARPGAHVDLVCAQADVTGKRQARSLSRCQQRLCHHHHKDARKQAKG